MHSNINKPNKKLREQREQRGWSQQTVVDRVLSLYKENKEDTPGMNAQMVSRWENGVCHPQKTYQEKLCLLYGVSAQELGFLERDDSDEVQIEMNGTSASSRQETLLLQTPPPVPPMLMQHSPLDTLNEPCNTPDQQLGAWLALGAGNLARLYDEKWTTDDILTSLHIVLRGVQHMPHIKRRQLLQLGAAAFLSGIPLPSSSEKHVSAQERDQLHTALGQSIAAGWSLFHRAGNAQVLAVGQAQLYLVQQSHSMVSSRVRAGFYASVYNLIGRAMHLQEHYEDALEAHINAHVAAMATGDPWYVTQSLICQADSYQALEIHNKAIEVIEEALRILGNPTEEEHIRTKAHLLACWADNAMTMREYTIAWRKLEESEVYLGQITPKEEFDRTSWHQLAGKCALMAKDFEKAIQHFEAGLTELPENWIVRRTGVLVPLAMAYARSHKRDESLAVARKVAPVVNMLNAPMTNRHFTEYVHQDLLGFYSNDSEVHGFVAEARKQLPMLSYI